MDHLAGNPKDGTQAQLRLGMPSPRHPTYSEPGHWWGVGVYPRKTRWAQKVWPQQLFTCK